MTWDEPGALGGTRTPNLLIRSQMLYPLSYERRCAAQSTACGAHPVLSSAGWNRAAGAAD